MKKLRKIPDTKILTKEQVRRYLYKQEVEEQKIICPVCGKRISYKDYQDIELIRNIAKVDRCYHSGCIMSEFRDGGASWKA